MIESEIKDMSARLDRLELLKKKRDRYWAYFAAACWAFNFYMWTYVDIFKVFG